MVRRVPGSRAPLNKPVDPVTEEMEFWWIGLRSPEASDSFADFCKYPEPPDEPWVQPYDARWADFIEETRLIHAEHKGYPSMVQSMWTTLLCPESGSVTKKLSEFEEDLLSLADDPCDLVRSRQIQAAQETVASYRAFVECLRTFRDLPSITGPTVDGSQIEKVRGLETVAQELFLQASSAGVHFERFIRGEVQHRGYAADMGRGGNAIQRPAWLRTLFKEVGATTPAKFFASYKDDHVWKKTEVLEDGICFLKGQADVLKARQGMRAPETMSKEELASAGIKVLEVSAKTFGRWLK